MYSLGIDVGGTFTDIVAVSDGSISVMKIPSTGRDPVEGIRSGLQAAARSLGLSVRELLQDTERFVHGTTVATNALLQYDGATTGLLTTEGFRDSLEMRRCHRKGQWDFFAPQPPLMVPRRLRRGIKERTLWDGSVDEPLDDAHLGAVVDELVREHGVEAIAICFLFSFKNPENEARAAAAIRERYPNLFVSASSDVAPQIREYERTCTAVVNAFVGPILSSYLERLGRYLREEGMEKELQVIQSNGGVTAAGAAGQHAVRAVMSGPAGGAVGGASLATLMGEPNLIVADMGGTSFDLTLVQSSEVSLVSEAEIAGYMISLPMIGIHTIGAGGGSIAYLDPGGILRVGPRSAGADPGPACYGHGGEEPTVTDANLALGLLNPEYFLGGAMPLEADRARRAIDERVAKPLAVSTTEAAQAIYEIVNSNMVDAIHVVTVQKGYDPREFALVAAGGAAAAHASALARALGIPRVIVPSAASVFCALGGLQADMRYDYVRTCLTKTGDASTEDLTSIFSELRTQGTARLERDGVPPPRRIFGYSLDMRYVGQHWDILVPVDLDDRGAPDLRVAARDFHRRHEQLHGYQLEERETEIVNCRVVAIGRSAKVEVPVKPLAGTGSANAIKGERTAYFGEEGFLRAAVYEGAKLLPGNELRGPAIVEQPNTTIVVGPRQNARLDGFENMIISA